MEPKLKAYGWAFLVNEPASQMMTPLERMELAEHVIHLWNNTPKTMGKLLMEGGPWQVKEERAVHWEEAAIGALMDESEEPPPPADRVGAADRLQLQADSLLRSQRRELELQVLAQDRSLTLLRDARDKLETELGLTQRTLDAALARERQLTVELAALAEKSATQHANIAHYQAKVAELEAKLGDGSERGLADRFFAILGREAADVLAENLGAPDEPQVPVREVNDWCSGLGARNAEAASLIRGLLIEHLLGDPEEKPATYAITDDVESTPF